MKRGNKTRILLLACLLTLLGAMTVQAASLKKISSVTIKVSGLIEPDTDFGEEELEITADGAHYSYDSYEVMNEGFLWTAEDTPLIKIYIHADENYYFSLTASKIKLLGATYVTAERQDSSTVLVVTCKLPPLSETVGAIQSVSLGSDGVARWDAVPGAGSYEVRISRSRAGVGSTYTTSENSFDCRPYMRRSGEYSVKVRPVNSVNTETKGLWVTSEPLHVSSELAESFQSASGEWEMDSIGWWYRRGDGSYPANAWEQINGSWYFFNQTGYMQTGWIFWNNQYYYCDVNTGAMLTNATAPDGRIVGSDGAMIQ